MIRTALVAAVVAFAVAAGWGCTQSPGGVAKSPAARLAALEAELADVRAAQVKLTDEATTALALVKAEQERSAGLVRERDELRVGLAARTAERDAARGRLDGFRTELKELLARVDGGSGVDLNAAIGVSPKR